MELHCWGSAEGEHPFHAESTAAIWYLLLSGLEFSIVPSSNHFKWELPCLLDDGKQTSGFDNIVRYLEPRFNLDSRLKMDHRVVNLGLKSLIRDKLNVITQYTLFLNKDNYENYTRGMFKNFLPFPMQYMPPLNFKSEATRICLQMGLNPDTGIVITEDDNRYREILETEAQLKQTPSMGMLYTSKQKQQLSKVFLEKNTINNMRALNLFENYLGHITNLKQDLVTVNNAFVFGENISTSDLLFFAHVKAVSFKDLPNQFISIKFQDFTPELYERYLAFEKMIEERLKIVTVVTPEPQDYPSLFNYCKYKVW